jgi:hypothetical protein
MIFGLLVHCKTEVRKRTGRQYYHVASPNSFVVLKQPTAQSLISTYTWNN